MPRRIGIAVLLLAVGVVIGVTLRPNIAADPPKEKEEKEKPIPVSEVFKRGVLGLLGHPLGTFVTIEGEVVDGTYTNAKADEGKTLLLVKSVNGTELKQGTVFRYEGTDADKPKVGAKFKYRGYETGRFEGLLFDKGDLMMAGIPYGFRLHFVITKDELKPDKK